MVIKVCVVQPTKCLARNRITIFSAKEDRCGLVSRSFQRAKTSTRALARSYLIANYPSIRFAAAPRTEEKSLYLLLSHLHTVLSKGNKQCRATNISKRSRSHHFPRVISGEEAAEIRTPTVSDAANARDPTLLQTAVVGGRKPAAVRAAPSHRTTTMTESGADAAHNHTKTRRQRWTALGTTPVGSRARTRAPVRIVGQTTCACDNVSDISLEDHRVAAPKAGARSRAFSSVACSEGLGPSYQGKGRAKSR
jgi:hypothetical protein